MSIMLIFHLNLNVMNAIKKKIKDQIKQKVNETYI